jgi:small subunit ribosomal protein S4e
MANKGGGTKLKRQAAPNFWKIERKRSRFVLKVSPGPHSKSSSYPLGVVLRDILKVCRTMHEAKIIVKGRKVKIDGQICPDVNRAIGLMDVLEFIPSGEAFRFIAKDSDILRPVPISHQETKSKIAKISRKVKVRGGKLQYGFHDGKTITSDEEMNVGDSCILSIPEMKVTNRIKFEKGCSALVTRGENAGVIGRVEDVREGIFSLPKRALLSFANRSVELPVDIVIPVVPEEPAIRVSQE